MTSHVAHATHPGAPASGFEHAGAFAGAPDLLCDALLAEIDGGLARGARVTAAVGPRLRDRLRSARPDAGAGLRFADRGAFYDAPGRTVAALHRLALEAGPSGALFVGEPLLPADRPVELAHWQRLETELGTALAGHRLRVVCAHLTSELPEEVGEAALAAHPCLATPEGPRANPAHRPVPEAGAPAPPPAGAPVLSMDLAADLALVREDAAALADAAGIPDERRSDLVIAVNELAANVLEHGAGKGTVSLWHEDGRVVCEVHDPSPELDDRSVGLRPADTSGDRGYGLWITRQVCDFFEVLPGPEGTRVRLHFRLG
ncbi:anti-sigma factor RsbA family regulatory protein [Nocardiopsis potens]|uniref:anti-sigma factor RsbA family regulatory protein n=1 Tax=Nocardiopsis potens TaxID=1246458 RepID=UPI000348956B|nr:anti-sigma factor RsbA family regulatory protein [Nocardiopsis potens]